MDNWILGVWFLGAFAIGGTAYMLGGYATAPKAAIILWAVFAVWMVTGPTIWFHQNYTIVRRSLLSAANGEVPQPIPTQIRWQFLGGQQAPTVLYEQNIATWYTMWTPSIVVSGLDVHGKLTNQVSTGPYWTIFLLSNRPLRTNK